ncbi:hypothetical protein J7S27_00810 [Carnobacteriaceae bacterium zg-C25]|nr:hypothetical protein [Carnobacteriaceae bacterium zg-ZUI240]QTU83097.1 hypothetical protein J7S27_00810 [Carnobacteriaceae bacterium zg-C25]
MESEILAFSQFKSEPQAIETLRLKAHRQVNEQYALMSFDERDDTGFGVLANVAHNETVICQYGTITTLEQVDYALMQAGVVVSDLFDAMEQYNLTNVWEKLSLRHQAYTNSGVYIYVPEGMCLDVTCYFVQDNSVVEDLIKSVIIVKGKNAHVNVTYHQLSVGENHNQYHLEIVEIDEMAC